MYALTSTVRYWICVCSLATAISFALTCSTLAQVDSPTDNSKIPEPRLDVISAENRLVASFENSSRAKVLEALFSSDKAEIKWSNSEYANEVISGRFVGTKEEIAQKLTSGVSLIISYRKSCITDCVKTVKIIGGLASSREEPSLADEPELLKPDDAANITIAGYGSQERNITTDQTVPLKPLSPEVLERRKRVQEALARQRRPQYETPIILPPHIRERQNRVIEKLRVLRRKPD